MKMRQSPWRSRRLWTLVATIVLTLAVPSMCEAGETTRQLRKEDGMAPSVITNPGAKFQDDARPGAMIIGMDRTPKGRIWGCWTGTGDKPDGYFLLATSDDDGATWSKPRLFGGLAAMQLCGNSS